MTISLEDLKTIGRVDVAKVTLIVEKDGVITTLEADTSIVRLEVEWKHEDGQTDYFNDRSAYFGNPWLAPHDRLKWTLTGEMNMKRTTVPAGSEPL